MSGARPRHVRDMSTGAFDGAEGREAEAEAARDYIEAQFATDSASGQSTHASRLDLGSISARRSSPGTSATGRST